MASLKIWVPWVPLESDLIYFHDCCCPQKSYRIPKRFSESILDPFKMQIILLKAASVNASGLLSHIKGLLPKYPINLSCFGKKKNNRILIMPDFVAYNKLLGIVPATPSVVAMVFPSNII